MVATEVHRRLVSDCDGCSEWQALAGGGYWRGAGGGRHPCARAKSIRGWQDLCAVHDLRASGGENAPWWQDVRAAYSPTALCGAFWIHSTHILPKVAESEYMAAIYCHELVFFLSEAPSGTHRGLSLIHILPSIGYVGKREIEDRRMGAELFGQRSLYD